MNRVSLSQKNGIFKPNKAKEHQKLKKSIRYFTMNLPPDLPDTANKTFSGSSSQFIKATKKQKIIRAKDKQLNGDDVTCKLLALVPPTANTVRAVSHSPFTRSSDQENGNVKSDLRTSVPTENVDEPVEGLTEEIKKKCIVNFVEANSGNGIKSNQFKTNKENSKKDIKNNKKKKKIGKTTPCSNVHLNKNQHVTSYVQVMNEQQINEKANGEISELKNATSEQDKVGLNESSKNSSSFKNSGPEIIMNQNKKPKSGRKRKKDNKIMPTGTKDLLVLSTQEGKKVPLHVTKKKQKSNAQTSLVECYSGIIKKDVGTSGLLETSKKQNKKTSKIRVSLDNKSDFDYHERGSGGWNVIDSDKLARDTMSLKRVQKSAKEKNINSKFSNVLTCDNFAQKLEVKVPKKPLKKAFNSANQKLSNSQPILVEMSGNNEASSNLFYPNVLDLKRKITQSSFNSKSVLKWKTCKSIYSTDKWEVQYGNATQLVNVEQQFSKVEQQQQQLSNMNDLVAVSMENETGPDTIENSITEETVDKVNSYEPYQLFGVSETKVILALPPSSCVYFQGAVKVKVLLGNISLLGLEISDTNHQEYTVYSPYGVSLLGFQSCVKPVTFSSYEEYWELVKEKIQNTNVIILDKILQNISPFSSLLLLESVSETLITLLHKYFPSVKYFPSALSRSTVGDDYSTVLKALFVDPRSTPFKLYQQPLIWNSVTSFLMKRKIGSMRVMAFGGKGVGKSTFLRFLVNQTLSQFKEILYIDFDIGQCEFSIPGCVSASIVKNPLLGPNFTHLAHPARLIYVGVINVTECVDRYLQSIQHILDWCLNQPDLSKLPWFINTMGFVQGLGADLAVQMIKMVNPSDVIQIESSVPNRNYTFSLNFENVQNYPSTLQAVVSSQERTLSPFSFHVLPAAAERSDNQRAPWGVQANVARETVLVSYFSQVVTPPAFSLLEVIPHVLSFSRLKLCVTSEKVKYSDYLSAMNANLVALCEVQDGNSLIPSDPGYPEILEKAPISHCFGFGIVRGVDIEKKQIFIISPLNAEKMNYVNCLVLGSVHLPERIFISQDEARGTIPYVVEGALLPLARGVRSAKAVIKLKK